MTFTVPFTTEPETRPVYPCTAFRWTFQVQGDLIGFVHQHHLGGRWLDSHTRVNAVWFDPGQPWWPSIDHAWYDGPHCTFRIGPFVFQWHNPGCRKCCDA